MVVTELPIIFCASRTSTCASCLESVSWLRIILQYLEEFLTRSSFFYEK